MRMVRVIGQGVCSGMGGFLFLLVSMEPLPGLLMLLRMLLTYAVEADA